jgi:hypothetical protein
MHKFAVLFLLSILLPSCQTSLSDKELASYKEKGLLISKSTGKELSETLTHKMKSGGLIEAVEFCNAAALPITQQMSDKHGVLIKRTSLKTRNPLNKPSDNEIVVLKEFQVDLDKGITLEPKVELDQNGIANYYAPILVEKKCLICHGTLDQELSKAADSIIKSHYPKDLATGFKEGDLRGIWSISFSKPNS